MCFSFTLASQVDRRLFCLKMNIKLPVKCVKTWIEHPRIYPIHSFRVVKIFVKCRMSNPQFVFHRNCFSLPGKTSEWHILSSTERCTHGLSRNRSHCFYCCVYNSAIIEREEKKCAVYSSHVVPTLFMSPVSRVEGVLAKIECIFGTNIYLFSANIKGSVSQNWMHILDKYLYFLRKY